MQRHIIEFFSGSKTVSNFFISKGWQATTVDINPKLNPSICCDILDLPFDLLPAKPDFLWFSPDCSKFSRMASPHNWKKTTLKYRIFHYEPLTPGARNSVTYLNKSIQIIQHFNKCPIIIENPIGRIHHFSAIKNLGHYRYAINYADFGFPYSKETYLFTNIMLPFSTKKVHSKKPGLQSVKNKSQRPQVPLQLIQTIFNYL